MEIQDFIRENRFQVDGSEFFDYYESNGWKVGKSAMKNWQACVRNWHRRSDAKTPRVKPLTDEELGRPRACTSAEIKAMSKTGFNGRRLIPEHVASNEIAEALAKAGIN